MSPFQKAISFFQEVLLNRVCTLQVMTSVAGQSFGPRAGVIAKIDRWGFAYIRVKVFRNNPGTHMKEYRTQCFQAWPLGDGVYVCGDLAPNNPLEGRVTRSANAVKDQPVKTSERSTNS